MAGNFSGEKCSEDNHIDMYEQIRADAIRLADERATKSGKASEVTAYNICRCGLRLSVTATSQVGVSAFQILRTLAR